jgi:serine/threonine-protein kinase/endoribonuclease IRE1
METDPPEPTLVALEADAASVVGKDWYSRADKVFTSNLGKYRKYKGNSVRDLLRAMRNKVGGSRLAYFTLCAGVRIV